MRVVAHVGDAGQAKPHLAHNPLSLLGTCHATPRRKLHDPAPHFDMPATRGDNPPQRNSPQRKNRSTFGEGRAAVHVDLLRRQYRVLTLGALLVAVTIVAGSGRTAAAPAALHGEITFLLS